jgi:hypothetical protein
MAHEFRKHSLAISLSPNIAELTTDTALLETTEWYVRV